MFVKQVFSQAVLRSSHTAQVGQVVSQLFDGLHLLVQVVSLNEVAQLEGKKKQKAKKGLRALVYRKVTECCSKKSATFTFREREKFKM